VEPGELIRAARRRKGLSQAELARRAGTSRSAVSAYENARRDPSIATLRRLIEAAGERLSITAHPPAPGLDPPRDVHEHARRLLDVLSIADAVPARTPSRTLQAPRLVSTRR
jgi:transcriptional regulator with XRE-family HTH domain